MRKKLIWIIPISLLLAVLAFYLYPAPQAEFYELYEEVNPVLTASLQDFRENNPLKTIDVDGVIWNYITLGDGEEAILFLHGMTGAYDIWWQQAEALEDAYRIVTLTYPPINNLVAIENGILAILENENLDRVNIVGSSLGGYIAQYFVTQHPEVVKRAVFANTFPPNDIIAEENRLVGALLPYMPEWLVMSFLRSSFHESIYPASDHNELVLAYLLEISYGRMSVADVDGRYRSVIDPFEPFDIETQGIPVMIIEASNDPLVDKVLKDQLKQTYPSARVETMGDVGHFPYINEAHAYTVLLESFFHGTSR